MAFARRTGTLLPPFPGCGAHTPSLDAVVPPPLPALGCEGDRDPGPSRNNFCKINSLAATPVQAGIHVARAWCRLPESCPRGNDDAAS